MKCKSTGGLVITATLFLSNSSSNFSKWLPWTGTGNSPGSRTDNPREPRRIIQCNTD